MHYHRSGLLIRQGLSVDLRLNLENTVARILSDYEAGWRIFGRGTEVPISLLSKISYSSQCSSMFYPSTW